MICIGLLAQSLAGQFHVNLFGLTLWWIIIGIALTLTGFWERMKMRYYGLLVVITGLIFEIATAIIITLNSRATSSCLD